MFNVWFNSDFDPNIISVCYSSLASARFRMTAVLDIILGAFSRVRAFLTTLQEDLAALFALLHTVCAVHALWKTTPSPADAADLDDVLHAPRCRCPPRPRLGIAIISSSSFLSSVYAPWYTHDALTCNMRIFMCIHFLSISSLFF